MVRLLLVLENYLEFLRKGQFKKGRKERLQRDINIPLEPIVWASSGKSISCCAPKGYRLAN
jgi:hypothetical protein